jgi:hypothetical protein
VPFRRARVRHRLDDLILFGERRRAALGLAAHLTERFDPGAAQVAGACRNAARHRRDIALAVKTRDG